MDDLMIYCDVMCDCAADRDLTDVYAAVEGVSSWRRKEVLEFFEALSKLREAALDDVWNDGVEAVAVIEGQFRAMRLKPKHWTAYAPSVIIFGIVLNSESNTLGPYCACGLSKPNAHIVAWTLAIRVLDKLRMAGCQAPPDNSRIIEPKSVGKNWPEAKAVILDVLSEDLDRLLLALKLELAILERSVLDKLQSQMLPRRESKSCPWDAPTEERNRFIYEEWPKGTPVKTIRAEVNKHPDWDPIETDNGIKAAAGRYARVHDLPPPRPRKQGRPKSSVSGN